jgi:hypothetical protein
MSDAKRQATCRAPSRGRHAARRQILDELSRFAQPAAIVGPHNVNFA